MKVDKSKIFRYGVCAICLLFYIFWFWLDGIRIEADTNGYVNFSMAREPLYPVFLAIFRNIFGPNYFMWVGIFQSIFWGYTVWYVCDSLYKELHLDKVSYGVMVGFCFLTSLMTRFVANRKAMYSLDIASEGIAIPLFLVFVIQLLLYILNRQNKYLWQIFILGTLLISVRKQMYIVIPIMAIVFSLLWIFRQIRLKKFLVLLGVTMLTLVSSVLLDVGYNLVIRGEAVRHSTDSSALLITTLYTADEKDAVYIGDEMVRQLFQDIIMRRNEEGWGYVDAPNGWWGISGHYAANFDNIAFGIVNPLFYECLEEQGIQEYVELELAFGKLNNYMLSSIFWPNLQRIFHVFVANALSGACNTVAKDSGYLVTFVVLLYLLYLLGLVFLGLKEKLIPEVWFGLITLVCIIVNVMAVSAMIFSQSRYMIYNMPIFYCAGYAILRKIVWVMLERKRKKNG